MKAKYPKIATFNEEFIAERTDDSVVKILTKGKGEDMKSFKDKLTPDGDGRGREVRAPAGLERRRLIGELRSSF